MNIFKTWWRNMGKVDALRREREAELAFDAYAYRGRNEEFKKETQIIRLQMQIDILRAGLTEIAEERQDFTKADFMGQLDALLEAKASLALQNSLPNAVQSITEQVEKSYFAEHAKLMLIAFGDRSMTPEEAEEKFKDYLKDGAGDLLAERVRP